MIDRTICMIDHAICMIDRAKLFLRTRHHTRKIKTTMENWTTFFLTIHSNGNVHEQKFQCTPSCAFADGQVILFLLCIRRQVEEFGSNVAALMIQIRTFQDNNHSGPNDPRLRRPNSSLTSTTIEHSVWGARREVG